MQFQIAEWFWKLQFLFYLILYFIPFTFTLIEEGSEWNNLLIEVCMVPIFFFLAVELTQIYEQKFEYFIGWNIFDFLQIVLFFLLYYLEYHIKDG